MLPGASILLWNLPSLWEMTVAESTGMKWDICMEREREGGGEGEKGRERESIKHKN